MTSGAIAVDVVTPPFSRPTSIDITTATIDPAAESQTQPQISGVEPSSSSPPSPPSLRSSVSWKSFRSRVSVSEKTSAQLGWAVAFLSVLITILTLSPAFQSQEASEKALRLAEWTALKDYIEECREELAAGIQSQACLRAMNAKLPPPPYVKSGVLDSMRRGLLMKYTHQESNGTSRAIHSEHVNADVVKAIQGLSVLVLLFTICIVIIIRLELLRRRPAFQQFHPSAPEKKQDDPITSTSPALEVPDPIATGTVRYPPPSIASTLRQRPVRTHPIYRHTNLESAIHHLDIPEIRTRLYNGEDVDKPWPYLIYSLAISPPSTPNIEKKLEVARICLDFGADVNALKGWNGQSALLIAIHYGNVAVADLLIKNGAMIGYSSPDSNLTALHRCVRLAVTGSADAALEIMELHFAHGANANQSDRLNETPLHKLMIDAWFSREDESMMKKLYPIAQCLVEHGARMPVIARKHTVGNPLWQILNSDAGESRWPERVGPKQEGTYVGGVWVKYVDDEAEELRRVRELRRSLDTRSAAEEWQYTRNDDFVRLRDGQGKLGY
ncbi:hypothetical protein BDV96DRAFT_590659 [Lophiotrema nucula]|uniref:Uncharacterized protein n=1 Tax=Lophiotrema nucula TaxID=690887 RepID=A0A6A5YKH0_9PLEO|nr:hypothetical protein BDV96DRAFT_590659 [Lophiotrema nucula]